MRGKTYKNREEGGPDNMKNNVFLRIWGRMTSLGAR